MDKETLVQGLVRRGCGRVLERRLAKIGEYLGAAEERHCRVIVALGNVLEGRALRDAVLEKLNIASLENGGVCVHNILVLEEDRSLELDRNTRKAGLGQAHVARQVDGEWQIREPAHGMSRQVNEDTDRVAYRERLAVINRCALVHLLPRLVSVAVAVLVKPNGGFEGRSTARPANANMGTVEHFRFGSPAGCGGSCSC